MKASEKWQLARLFPVTGIGNPNEQERRATSVLLAVLGSVKEFGRVLTNRCGAPAGSIHTYIEVPFELGSVHCRPDGLIRVIRGQNSWTALVEVKTGRNDLDADQVSMYLDVARDHDFDAVITISHQVATTPGVHPVPVDRRKTRKVSLVHLSWSRIHTEAIIQHGNHEVPDPVQAWLLSEFVRYLEDPKSGALDFEDMGPSWVSVRNGAAKQTLRANDPETISVVARFDQLLAFCAMELSRRLGVHVTQRLSRSELDEPALRLQAQAAGLSESGLLSGVLLVPNAAVPFEVAVDLRANRIDARATIPVPTDRGARSRLTWLLKQLKGAPSDLQVVANVARSKTAGRSYELATLVDDPRKIVEQPHADIRSFTLTLSQHSGTKRGQGQGSFVNSVTSLVDRFYNEVAQPLKPWTPPAPKPKAVTEAQSDLVEPSAVVPDGSEATIPTGVAIAGDSAGEIVPALPRPIDA
jgi:hypothetical protein